MLQLCEYSVDMAACWCYIFGKCVKCCCLEKSILSILGKIMKKNIIHLALGSLAVSFWPLAAEAHFLELIPSTDIVGAGSARKVEMDLRFSHPMENGPAMEMAKPDQYFVVHGGEKQDLLPTLRPQKVDGKSAYTSTYSITTPGDYVFAVAPAPYWEPAEQKMIIHYTKVVVNGFGDESGWDEPVHFPVEIDPLVRPYGTWTGNVFRGMVKHNGKPVPLAEVEVEYLNTDKKVDIPADPFITQVIKADLFGVFTYAMPKAGWWGFAALVEGDSLMENPEGKKVDVELGGLTWIKCVDME